MQISIIGFGEAGRAFASGLRRANVNVRAYDIKQNSPEGLDEITQAADTIDVRLVTSADRLAQGSDVVLSTVTAGQAVHAARSVLPTLQPGTLFVDLNSAAPTDKVCAAELVHAANADYVDGAAMDTVPRFGMAVPVLASGASADRAATLLNSLGFALTVIDGPVGAASTAKLLRSVIVKGLEALMAEAFLGAERAGVTDHVVQSLTQTYPGMNWREAAGYHLERMSRHGARRAMEMQASASVLRGMGVDPFLASAIAERQQWAADLSLIDQSAGDVPNSIAAYAAAVKRAEASLPKSCEPA